MSAAFALGCYLIAWGLATLVRALPAWGHVAALGLLALWLWLPVPAATAIDAAAEHVALSSDVSAAIPARLTRWSTIVDAAAATCGVDPALLYAIMDIESDGNPDAISSAGAVGLMQIMPRETGFPERPTAAELRDPTTNVDWSACHLRGLIDAYGLRDAARRYYGLGGTKTESYADEALRLYELYSAAPTQPGVVEQPATGGGCCAVWPVAGRITQAFAAPVGYAPGYHTGTDIAAPVGTPIYAAGSGTVLVADPLGATGPRDGLGPYAVWIAHDDGAISVYGHNSARHVVAGQRVAAGDHIADVGSTGYSTGPHLHFEIYEAGRFVDPLTIIRSEP